MRTVILYMAISADGFIATEDDSTPWSNDAWEAYERFVKSCDVCLIGRRTFEIMEKNEEFIDGVRYIVVTNNQTLDSGSYENLAISSADDLPLVGRVGVIGGGELNGRLAELGAIDEIILDIEPIVIGEGKRLFGNRTLNMNLKLLETRAIGAATVQNRYKVL